MALDDGRRPFERYRFDHIGIERALAEKARAAHHLFGLEHVDKGMADDAALLFGIEHVCEALRNSSEASVTLRSMPSWPAKTFSIRSRSPARSKPGIDEHALEPLADRAMDQRRRDRRIDAAGKPEQHLVARADLVANLGDLGLDEASPSSSRRARRKFSARSCAKPACRTAYAPPPDETGCRESGRRACAPPRTGEFALCAIERSAGGIDSTRSPWLIQTRCSWPSRPSNSASCSSIMQRGGTVLLAHAQRGVLRAQMLRDHIHAVADSEHGASSFSTSAIDIGRAFFVETRRPARQDDAARPQRANLSRARKL